MAKGKQQGITVEEILEQALVPIAEQPYKIPENWCWIRFGYLAEDMADGPFGSNLKREHYTEKKEVRIIQLSNIGENGWRDENIKYTTFEYAQTISRSIVKPGEIVIAKMMPAGRAIKVPCEEKAYILSSDAVKFVPKKMINTEYLLYAINSSFFINQVTSETQGITRARTSIKKLKTYAVAFAPLVEQQRIVECINSLFEKLDNAKELVQRTLDAFEARKVAILHKAVTGELTNKWREKNQVPPVKAITDDMDKERYNLQKNYAVEQGNKTFNYKKAVEININGETKGIDDLFELPDTWEWVSLGQVSWNISDGPHFSPQYVDESIGVPMISARNVKYKNIDFSDAKYVSVSDYMDFIKRGVPEIGDVLLTKGGTTGIATTVDTERKFCVWVHVALIKVIKRFINPEYLRDVLASSILYRQSQEQTHGVGNQDLGLTRMIYMALPLPPLQEQNEIVRILENLLENEQKAQELCDVIEKIELMKKTILARAFRGELGTNDPSEESAIETLKECLK